MTLAQRLAEPPIKQGKQYCSVGWVLDNLHAQGEDGSKDYVALTVALGVSAWSAMDIQRSLREENYSVPVRHIREHRNGQHNAQNCAAHEVGLL